MKILLVYPYFIEERIQTEDVTSVPIGVYTIAALLKENHYDVDILNCHNMQKAPDKIKEALIVEKPDVIGFSIHHGNRWGGIEIARMAKKLDTKVRIVVGGVGATFLWRHLLTHFIEIDFVVIGEGEYTFLDLVRAIEKGDDEKFTTIRGLAFRKGGRIVRTEDRELIQDLNELPIPAAHFVYQHVASTRGCPWKCAFCGSPRIWGKRIRFRSPEHFVKELELLYGKGVTFFYFSDDSFTIDKERVLEICKKILEKDLKISWYAISRVDCIDDEMLHWMRKAGCIQISYGVESGSEKIRRLLGKNIGKEEIKQAFRSTMSHGILARAYFIYGSPGETWETIQETIDLIHEIKPLSVVFYILDLFPGTELWSSLQKRLQITDEIWLEKVEGIMYFETDPRLSDELILAFGEKLRMDFYENLHSFVDSIRLMDSKDLYEAHSDFCSRLGMTFSHGDYSRIDSIREKDKVAEKLYAKALSYHPNYRAYLGLGILKQKKREYRKSIEILSEGIKFFPESEELNLCLGISYMNLKDYEAALSCFSKFSDSEQADYYMGRCYEEMGS